ncbi:MAG: hypothetical protein RL357_329 [Pseudomonadota bacterium]
MTEVKRQAIHRRQVVYDAFVREDGLFDIEARLLDTRTYDSYDAERLPIPTGVPVHDIVITITVDEQLVIQSIGSNMHHIPTAECRQTQPVLQKLVGKTMGRGWRKAIAEAMGGVEGCTHMRELLANMATAAYQAVPIYSRFYGKGPNAASEIKEPPPHLNQCMTWKLDGEPVRRLYPQFYIAPAEEA